VSKIDPSTGTTDTILVGGGPQAVAFDGTSIWVANRDSDSVSKIDPVHEVVRATVPVEDFPLGVAFDGTNIWVTNAESGEVSKIVPF
jgi:YVTN family beta-propeller protein